MLTARAAWAGHERVFSRQARADYPGLAPACLSQSTPGPERAAEDGQRITGFNLTRIGGRGFPYMKQPSSLTARPLEGAYPDSWYQLVSPPLLRTSELRCSVR